MKDRQKGTEDSAGREVSVRIFFTGAVEHKTDDRRGNLCAVWVLGSALSLCNGFSFLLIRSGCW